MTRYSGSAGKRLQKIRDAKRKQQDNKCFWCESEFSEDNVTGDHVIPHSEGGRISWKNIVAACLKCNQTRGWISDKDNPYKEQTDGRITDDSQ